MMRTATDSPVAGRQNARAAASSSTSIAVWNCHAVALVDFLRHYPAPTVARLARVSHRGHNGSADPEADVNKPPRLIYVHCVSAVTVAVADGLHLASVGQDAAGTSTSRHLVPTGCRYAIPVDYRGWFELLSQDGHAAAPISTIRQLIDTVVTGGGQSQRFLVRQTIIGLSVDGQEGVGGLEGTGGRGALVKVDAGETLTTVSVTQQHRDGDQVTVGGAGSASRRQQSVFLRCRVERSRVDVLFSADQRCTFSLVAGPTSVVGVHRIRSVVAKFRLPVVVRLVDITGSSGGASGGGGGSSGGGGTVFRVVDLRSEDVAHVLPLWVVQTPAAIDRSTLLAMPTSADASAVLDAAVPTVPTGDGRSRGGDSASSWTDSDWAEVRRRCDDLIASHPVSSICRLLSSTVDSPTRLVCRLERRLTGSDAVVNGGSGGGGGGGGGGSVRASPTNSSSGRRPVPPPTVEEERLLSEIDDIYNAIRNGGGASTPDFRAQQHRAPAPAKTVGIDTGSSRREDLVLSSFRATGGPSAHQTRLTLRESELGTGCHGSPARRSHTLDPSFLKTERFGKPRVPSRSPGPATATLHRVVSTSAATSRSRRSDHVTHPPAVQHVFQQHHQQPHFYEDLKPFSGTAGEVVMATGEVVMATTSPETSADRLRAHQIKPEVAALSTTKTQHDSVVLPVADTSFDAKYVSLCDVPPPPPDTDRPRSNRVQQSSGSTTGRIITARRRPKSFAGSGDIVWDSDASATKAAAAGKEHGPPALPLRRFQSDASSQRVNGQRVASVQGGSSSGGSGSNHGGGGSPLVERPTSADPGNANPSTGARSSPLDAIGAISRSLVRSFRRRGTHQTMVLNNPEKASSTSGKSFGCRIITDENATTAKDKSTRKAATSGGGAAEPSRLQEGVGVNQSDVVAAPDRVMLFTEVTRL